MKYKTGLNFHIVKLWLVYIICILYTYINLH